MNKEIRAIQTREDYEDMVRLVDELIDAEPGSKDFETLQIVSDLVWVWEQKNVEVGPPDPIEAIKFRLEQLGMSLRDLRPYIGSDARVSEVLSGKRELTLKMVRALHAHMEIPLESLVRERAASLTEDFEVGKYPIPEMMKYLWLGPYSDVKRDQEEEAWNWLLDVGDSAHFQQPVLCRQNSSSYANVKTNLNALYAWCLHLRAVAGKQSLPRKFAPDHLGTAFLNDLARLSRFTDGPALAKEKLNSIGIHIVFQRHLKGTYLDGAALLLADDTPVIGMTLRHDRLDNFWHCLLHELVHVWRHLGKPDLPSCFHDDFDVTGDLDEVEQEADRFACEALLPDSAISQLGNLTFVSTGDVRELAEKYQVHQAVVAGRIRFKTKNYGKFAKLLGYGEPTRILGEPL